MNANNLMAVSTADGISAGTGAPKGRTGSAGNRAQATSGKNSFSDTFGALQKGMDAGAAKTQTRKAPTSTTQTKVPQVESNALSQDTQDVTAKGPKTGAEKKISSTDDSIASSVAAAVAAVVNTDAAPVDSDVNEGLDSALMEILQRYELTADQLGDTKLQSAVRSLLQQLPEEGIKSRNFLLALAGQPLTEEENGNVFLALTEEGAAANPSAAVQSTRMPQDLGAVPQVLRLTALSSQQSTALNPDAPLTSEQTPVMNATAMLRGQTSAGTVETAALVNTAAGNAQTAMENVAAPILRAQAEPLSSAQGKSGAQLVGENLIVEDGAEAANPLTVLAQRTMRHDASQGDAAGQEEQPMQSGQQTARMTTTLPFEVPTRGAETTPQPAQPIAAQTSMAPAQEVVTPEPTQEAQRPQPDYEIPRQIVEQARLLRTLTDTQMVIRLRPEHLGELTLRVAVGADGAVQASFHSDNAHVRNVIENSLVQLRQELNNQGIKIDRVGVYAGLADGQMPQSQGQEAWQQSSGQHNGAQQVYARGDADDYLDEIDGLAPIAAEETGGSVGAEGVDYRV